MGELRANLLRHHCPSGQPAENESIDVGTEAGRGTEAMQRDTKEHTGRAARAYQLSLSSEFM